MYDDSILYAKGQGACVFWILFSKDYLAKYTKKATKKPTVSHQQAKQPETHTKRQATQHGCLPSLLGDGDFKIEIVYGEEITVNVPVV